MYYMHHYFNVVYYMITKGSVHLETSYLEYKISKYLLLRL